MSFTGQGHTIKAHRRQKKKTNKIKYTQSNKQITKIIIPTQKRSSHHHPLISFLLLSEEQKERKKEKTKIKTKTHATIHKDSEPGEQKKKHKRLNCGRDGTRWDGTRGTGRSKRTQPQSPAPTPNSIPNRSRPQSASPVQPRQKEEANGKWQR